MIKSFKHKGLELFFNTGNTKGIQAIHQNKIRLILGAIDSAKTVKVLNIPSFRLHKLKGDKKNLYSIIVQANWRITFEFKDKNAYIVNYEDYH